MFGIKKSNYCFLISSILERKRWGCVGEAGEYYQTTI